LNEGFGEAFCGLGMHGQPEFPDLVGLTREIPETSSNAPR
jgi:hypothetical protein